MVSKPAMRKSMEDIRIEIKGIHDKIDDQYQSDSVHFSRYLETMKIYKEVEKASSKEKK